MSEQQHKTPQSNNNSNETKKQAQDKCACSKKMSDLEKLLESLTKQVEVLSKKVELLENVLRGRK